MSKQKKKRTKKYVPQVTKAPIKPKPIKAHCKFCNTECKLWDGPDFISWRNLHAPDFKMDFLFVQQCNCWEEEGKEDWMEMVEG